MGTPRNGTVAPDMTTPTIRRLVEKLVDERSEMLVLFCRLAGVDTAHIGVVPAGSQRQRLLQRFCQLLMDYVAAGDLGLYEHILEDHDEAARLRPQVRDTFSRIADATEAALDFNDRYNCEDHCDLGNAFQADLSRLGERLAERIELEDRLFATLCQPPPPPLR